MREESLPFFAESMCVQHTDRGLTAESVWNTPVLLRATASSAIWPFFLFSASTPVICQILVTGELTSLLSLQTAILAPG